MSDKKNWSNVSLGTCVEMWELSNQVFIALGRLPQEKTPEDLRGTTTGEIMDFAQILLDDETVWNDLHVETLPGFTLRQKGKNAIRDYLRRQIEQSR